MLAEKSNNDIPNEYESLIEALGHFHIKREDVRGLLEMMDIREIVRYVSGEGYRVIFQEES